MPCCDSFDVKKNELGDVICFSCFSIAQNNDLDTMFVGKSIRCTSSISEKLEERKINGHTENVATILTI